PQPLIAATAGIAQPAHAQRHRALDVVPGVDVSVRPANRAVALLDRGNGAAGVGDLVRGQDASDLGYPDGRPAPPGPVRPQHAYPRTRRGSCRSAGSAPGPRYA